MSSTSLARGRHSFCFLILPIAFCWIAGLCLLSGCNRKPVNLEAEKKAAEALREVGGQFTETGGRVDKLDLVGKKLRDEDLANVGELAAVHQVMMSNATFPDDGLAHLAGCERLELMSFKGSSLTDAGLEHVGKISSLIQLDLEQTKITDAGLDQLSRLKNLRKLYLSGSAATQAGAEKLRRSLPKLSTVGP